MAQTVVGMFDNSSEAQQAVQKLVDSGITRDRIDISGNSNTSGSSYSSSSSADRHEDDHENGITRFFKNLFGDDDDDADKYAHVASRAQCIVTVHAQSDDEAERAADLLDDNGAVNVDERASEYGYRTGSMNTGTGLTGDYSDTNRTTNLSSTTTGLSGTDRSIGNDTTAGWSDKDRTYDSDKTYNTDSNRTGDDESKKIPIIEENLEVGKKEVQSGGMRLRSRIIERPVEESVRLRQERVNVERTTVDRPATESDFDSFKESNIEMVEHTEVPVVNKQARVVEEVSLNKEVEERSETVKDTVRKTEVDVDNLDKGDLKNRDSNDR
jgi:uncharacterized protein (TIGR02271 family)